MFFCYFSLIDPLLLFLLILFLYYNIQYFAIKIHGVTSFGKYVARLDQVTGLESGYMAYRFHRFFFIVLSLHLWVVL